MRKEITTAESESSNNLVLLNNSSPLLQSGMFGMMLQLAEVMAKSNTLPQHFHNKPGDCLRVIELAHRIGQSPYAIADGSYVIQGKFAMDGKTMASIINSHPSITGSLNYEYSGDKKKPETYICTVIGQLRGEAKPRKIEVSLALGLSDSKGAKPRWEKDPDQMLAYYGARVWARRHAPEVIGGLYTPDELKAGRYDDYEKAPDEEQTEIKVLEGVVVQKETPEKKIAAYLKEISTASSLNDLKMIYASAFNWAKVHAKDSAESIVVAKDARKAELEAGEKKDLNPEHADFIAALEEDVPQ
jgi:hypothetical protein